MAAPPRPRACRARCSGSPPGRPAPPRGRRAIGPGQAPALDVGRLEVPAPRHLLPVVAEHDVQAVLIAPTRRRGPQDLQGALAHRGRTPRVEGHHEHPRVEDRAARARGRGRARWGRGDRPRRQCRRRAPRLRSRRRGRGPRDGAASWSRWCRRPGRSRARRPGGSLGSRSRKSVARLRNAGSRTPSTSSGATSRHRRSSRPATLRSTRSRSVPLRPVWTTVAATWPGSCA